MSRLEDLKARELAAREARLKEEKRLYMEARKRRDRARYVLGGLEVVRLGAGSVDDAERLLSSLPEKDGAIVREAIEFERARNEKARTEQQPEREMVGNGNTTGNAEILPVAGNGFPSSRWP